MLRLHVIAVCVTYLHYSNAFIEQLVYKNQVPKCCSEGEALALDPNGNNPSLPYQCTFDVNRTSHILINETLSSFPWGLSERVSCIDNFIGEYPAERRVAMVNAETFEMNFLRLRQFSKCCPVDKAYDAMTHGCVLLENGTDTSLVEDILYDYLDKHLIYLNIGMSHCKSVLADYEVPSFDDILYQSDGSVTLENHNKNLNNYCIDKVFGGDTFIVRGCEDFSVCKKQENGTGVGCIAKCCDDGYYYKEGSKCRFDFSTGMNLFNDSKVISPYEPFAIVQGHNCTHYIVDVDWNYTLDRMGFLNLYLDDEIEQHPGIENQYCFEEVDIGATKGRRLFLCFKEDTNEAIKFQIYRIFLVFSCVFLILTLVGYICLPEMQNLHGKTLMCHCGSLLVAFIILAVLQFFPKHEGAYCKTMGYITMYTFHAAFMWSNVMCFDIWWTFGSMRVDGINQKKRERKRFLWYCLYSWTIPLVITLSAFTVQEFKSSLPESMEPLAPALGDFSCFFEESTNLVAFLVWFMLPIAIVCVCNTFFFVKTIMYCYKVKNEIEKMMDSNLSKNECNKILIADKERLRMVVRLLLVMGIPWMFEAISGACIPPDAGGPLEVVEIIFDSINVLQGFFIFCVFVLKMKFLKALKRRFTGKKRPHRIIRSNYSGVTASSYIDVTSPKLVNIST
ncbi:hypothetical protein PPYR_08176 [Photinus pyralis]|uniref:G-protein coupled receptors family 2 profile 2 domain-containing protein n=3 Tax=Photinus pyralis TaxID=7054 RepID=A0A5N4AIL2_PHOPY|nr:G-protein coupled receptor Mth-like [Photinus pyralis]KAB0797182.1 hypothetical protein PPYR_08176 [Photinus pyralis]